MARTSVPAVQRQVRRAARRLFASRLLTSLLWAWAAAGVLAGVWFVCQVYWLSEFSLRQRLGVAAALVALATLAGVIRTIARRPSGIEAALLIDQAFGLKERVTTSLALTPVLAASPAGRALLADANERVGRVRVREGVPVRVSWRAAVAPLLAAAIAGGAFFYRPAPSQATPGAMPDKAEAPKNPEELARKFDQLKKRTEPKVSEKAPSEELKRIETELEQIANRPRNSKDQLKERVKEMTALEDRLKARERELAERTEAMRRQLQQIDRAAGKQASQEGPAKDFQKALSDGKFDKAREELEKLAKKLQSNALTSKEKQQLARQLKDLKEKLERVAQQKDKAEQLQRLHQEGKLNAEALKREMQRLKEDAQKSKELQKLAEQLAQCQKCLEQGDPDNASKGLSGAAQQLNDMEVGEKDREEMQARLAQLEEAKDAATVNEQEMEGPGPGGEGIGSGRRPLSDPMATRSYETKLKGRFDKGRLVFDGYAPGPNFKKKTTADLAGEVRQAAQEAPEAIEQQRIPKAARDIAKGYFRNLAGPPTKQDDKP